MYETTVKFSTKPGVTEPKSFPKNSLFSNKAAKLEFAHLPERARYKRAKRSALDTYRASLARSSRTYTYIRTRLVVHTRVDAREHENTCEVWGVRNCAVWTYKSASKARYRFITCSLLDRLAGSASKSRASFFGNICKTFYFGTDWRGLRAREFCSGIWKFSRLRVRSYLLTTGCSITRAPKLNPDNRDSYWASR